MRRKTSAAQSRYECFNIKIVVKSAAQPCASSSCLRISKEEILLCNRNNQISRNSKATSPVTNPRFPKTPLSATLCHPLSNAATLSVFHAPATRTLLYSLTKPQNHLAYPAREKR
jgi:hypothetical protein